MRSMLKDFQQFKPREREGEKKEEKECWNALAINDWNLEWCFFQRYKRGKKRSGRGRSPDAEHDWRINRGKKQLFSVKRTQTETRPKFNSIKSKIL